MSKLKPIDMIRESQIVLVETESEHISYVVGRDLQGEIFLFRTDKYGYDYSLSEFDDNLVLKANPEIYVRKVDAISKFMQVENKTQFEGYADTLYLSYDSDVLDSHSICDVLQVDDAIIIEVDGKLKHCHFAKYNKLSGILETFPEGKTSFTSLGCETIKWTIANCNISLVNQHNRRLYNVNQES